MNGTSHPAEKRMKNIKRKDVRFSSNGTFPRTPFPAHVHVHVNIYTHIYKFCSLCPFGRCIEKSHPESVDGDHPLLLWSTTRVKGRSEKRRDDRSPSSNATPMGIAFRYNYPLFRGQLYWRWDLFTLFTLRNPAGSVGLLPRWGARFRLSISLLPSLSLVRCRIRVCIIYITCTLMRSRVPITGRELFLLHRHFLSDFLTAL